MVRKIKMIKYAIGLNIRKRKTKPLPKVKRLTLKEAGDILRKRKARRLMK